MMDRFTDAADRTLASPRCPRPLACVVGSIAVVAVVVVLSGCGGHGKSANTSATSPPPAQQSLPGTQIASKLQQQLLTEPPGIYLKEVRCLGTVQLGGSIACTGTLAGGRKVSVRVLVSGTAAAPKLKIATSPTP